MNRSLARFAILSVTAFIPRVAAQHPSMPPGMSHQEHMKQMSREAELSRRGDLSMEPTSGRARIIST